MKKTKIGQGYYPTAYGRGFRKKPTVWLINGKAYVKDSYTTPYETDLKGYTMVNKMQISDRVYFTQCSIIKDHLKYD